MTELVFKSNEGVAVTTSLKVAEIFGKSHEHVVRDLDNLVEKVESVDNQCNPNLATPTKMFEIYFEDVPQPNGGVKSAKRYIMNRDGFTLLVMGYTGKKAMAFKLEYIAAFNAMEKAIKEQAKPKSQLEILVESAQALLEQSRRMDKIESRLDAMEQERKENTKLLLAVSISQNELPKQSIRNKIRELVNKYSSAMNIKQGDVWHSVYNQLYYLFNISVNSYKRKKKESNLDVAERIGFIDKIYDIISNMVREAKIA